MTARGIRNFNPGNLRIGENWRGLSTVDNGDREFCVFIAPIYGIRALCKLLLNYQKKYDLKTIRQIIGRYAPDIENDTSAYVKHVSDSVGIDPDAPVDVTNPEAMSHMLTAIIMHENGQQPYTHEIDDAMLLAGIR